LLVILSTAAAVSGYNFSTFYGLLLIDNENPNFRCSVTPDSLILVHVHCTFYISLKPQTDRHTRHVASSCTAQTHMVSETSSSSSVRQKKIKAYSTRIITPEIVSIPAP